MSSREPFPYMADILHGDEDGEWLDAHIFGLKIGITMENISNLVFITVRSLLSMTLVCRKIRN